MPEAAAPAAPNGAPSVPQSPAGVAPASQPQQPQRRRISEMQEGLEEHNARMLDRQLEPPAPPPASEPEFHAAPEPTAPEDDDGLLPPEPEQQQVDPRGLQEQDKQLLDATKAWLDGGEMPDAFKSAIHEWTDKTTGAPRRATIKELEEGHLRQSDYQRNMNELRTYHQQVQFSEQANNQFWQEAREPLKLLEEMEDRGYGEVFHKAAVEYSLRRQKMKQVAEAAGYALMRQYGYPENHPDVVNAVRQTMQQQLQSRQLEIENRKLQKHNQMLAQMRQQQDGQQQQQHRLGELRSQLQPLIPAAFKSVGVRNHPKNVELWWSHLAAYVSNLPNWDGNVRRQHCVEAAKMVREELEDLAAARAPKRPPAQSRAMAPSRMSTSGSAQTAQAERKRISDMANDPRFNFGVG